jgi:predicted CopG family antitoxin
MVEAEGIKKYCEKKKTSVSDIIRKYIGRLVKGVY